MVHWTWMIEHGARDMEHRTLTYGALDDGALSMGPGTWTIEHRALTNAWCLERGACGMGNRALSMGHGSLTYGVWSVDHVAWDMEH